MTREEYILLFHKAQVNLVAFKPVFHCDEELRRMVEMAVEAEREKNRAYIHELEFELETTQDRLNELLVADYMKTRRQQ